MLAAPTVAANATTAAKTIPNTNIIFPFLNFKSNLSFLLTIFYCYPFFNLYLDPNTFVSWCNQSFFLIINTFRILILSIFYPFFLFPMQRYELLCSHTNISGEKFQNTPISWLRSRTFTFPLQKEAIFLKLLPFTFGRWPLVQGELIKAKESLSLGIKQKIRPIGVPPDLKSGVKKGPCLLKICGFEIRSKQDCFSYWCWGIANPPILIGRIFLTADCKSARTPNGSLSKHIHYLIEHPCNPHNPCLTYSTLPFPAFRSAHTCLWT